MGLSHKKENVGSERYKGPLIVQVCFSSYVAKYYQVCHCENLFLKQLYGNLDEHTH